MVDIVDAETRHRMMSGIRGKNTKPELQIRRLLFARGFRYRLHLKGLPGKPDLVLTKHRAVIFVHGCFWHRHHCHLFKWPSTRRDFWREKIDRNVERDRKNETRLHDEGWRVATVWECALKGRIRLEPDEVADQLSNWLQCTISTIEIKGKPDKEARGEIGVSD